MKRRLSECLAGCQKEEEVKAEFCKFFGMKICALKAIDHYTPNVLFEFKFDRRFDSPANVAPVLAQTLYYARLIKFKLTKYALPHSICVVDRNEAFFVETRDFAPFYTSRTFKYDWDRAASTPCPVLVADVESFIEKRPVYVYDLTNEKSEAEFVETCRAKLIAQATFDDLLDKKEITEENFLDVYEYWRSLFGKYVENGRKASEYFLADIERGKVKSDVAGEVSFNVENGTWVRKSVQAKTYEHFWQKYDHVDPQVIPQIRQKYDRLTEDYRRRFTGEFYTPVEFASKGLDYLERELGQRWWESGDYRFWDMAAGTGNLEFELPAAALPYCYVSTLEDTEAKYCQKIFPLATCFQYNYLEDDIASLEGGLNFGGGAGARKMPAKLAADLVNPRLKWIVFINPPFATANNVCDDVGKKSKTAVSQTPIREWMHREGYGEASRELCTQFLFRISKEFAGKDARLCLSDVRKWKCPVKDVQESLDAATDERFLATWLKGRDLSPEAQAVLDAAKRAYRRFYADIASSNWADYKVQTWDLGFYQIVQSAKGTSVAKEELAELRAAHDALREKLLPQITDYGFINHDVEYF